MGRHSKDIPSPRRGAENKDAFFSDGERIRCGLPPPKGDGRTRDDAWAEIQETLAQLGIAAPERKSLAGVPSAGGAR